jgi:glutathione synthase
VKTRPRAPLLWITDPWDTLDHARDTTLRLMEECGRLGIPCSWADVKSIRWENGAARVDARLLAGVKPGRGPRAFQFRDRRGAPLRDFSRAIYRTDPPVDLAYIHPLQLLALSGVEVVNPLRALLLHNEKLEGAFLGDLMPATCAASSWDALERFGRAEGRAVLKPFHQAQSKGVELLDFRSPAKRAAAKRACARTSAGFTTPVILQRYLPGILEGEQRLWFLNGRLLAVAKKVPAHGSFRIDMDRGGSLAASTLNARERRAATQVGKRLRELQCRMAAVDLIEGKVTDFNLTSPGLLTPMEALLRENLSRPVVESLIRPWK